MSETDLTDMLLAGNSKFNIELVAAHVGFEQERFDELIALMLTGKPPIPQRAAWAMAVITDRLPELMAPHAEKLIDLIGSFGHTAMHRCVLRYFSTSKIPETKWGVMINICYKYLLDNNMPPAVKVHAMQIIFNISDSEPDLKEELRLTIESIIDDGVPAIMSRGGKLLKKLSK